MKYLSFFSLLLFVGCQNFCDNKAKYDENDVRVDQKEIDPKSAIAIVNEKAIDSTKVESLYEASVSRLKKTGREVDETLGQKIKASIIGKVIDDEIIKQKAEKEGIKIDRIERIDALNEYKTKIGGDKPYDMFIKQSGISEDELLENLEREKLREKLAHKLLGNYSPSDTEIEEHFNKNKNLYEMPEMVKAKHILLKYTQNEGSEKEAEVLKKINDILAQVKEPNSNFETLAKKYSECPSAQNGGDLGLFPRGKMVKPFEDAAFSSNLKTPIGPIKTDYGYHIIWVEEKTPHRTASLPEVKDRIKEFLTHTKQSRGLEETLQKLRKEAKITINDKSLSLEQYLGELAPKENKGN